MTEYSTQDYVRASLAGDAIKAQEIFNQLMAPKVVDAIADKKVEIAQSYFGKPELEATAAEQTADETDATETEEEQAEVADEQVTDQEEETDENAE